MVLGKNYKKNIKELLIRSIPLKYDSMGDLFSFDLFIAIKKEVVNKINEESSNYENDIVL